MHVTHRSSRVREGIVNVVIAALVLFDAARFDFELLVRPLSSCLMRGGCLAGKGRGECLHRHLSCRARTSPIPTSHLCVRSAVCFATTPSPSPQKNPFDLVHARTQVVNLAPFLYDRTQRVRFAILEASAVLNHRMDGRLPATLSKYIDAETLRVVMRRCATGVLPTATSDGVVEHLLSEEALAELDATLPAARAETGDGNEAPTVVNHHATSPVAETPRRKSPSVRPLDSSATSSASAAPTTPSVRIGNRRVEVAAGVVSPGSDDSRGGLRDILGWDGSGGDPHAAPGGGGGYASRHQFHARRRARTRGGGGGGESSGGADGDGNHGSGSGSGRRRRRRRPKSETYISEERRRQRQVVAERKVGSAQGATRGSAGGNGAGGQFTPRLNQLGRIKREAALRRNSLPPGDAESGLEGAGASRRDPSRRGEGRRGRPRHHHYQRTESGSSLTGAAANEHGAAIAGGGKAGYRKERRVSSLSTSTKTENSSVYEDDPFAPLDGGSYSSIATPPSQQPSRQRGSSRRLGGETAAVSPGAAALLALRPRLDTQPSNANGHGAADTQRMRPRRRELQRHRSTESPPSPAAEDRLAALATERRGVAAAAKRVAGTPRRKRIRPVGQLVIDTPSHQRLAQRPASAASAPVVARSPLGSPLGSGRFGSGTRSKPPTRASTAASRRPAPPASVSECLAMMASSDWEEVALGLAALEREAATDRDAVAGSLKEVG